MFPHNNHNQFMPHTPPPPHFAASSLADGGPNVRGGGVGNALGMGVGGGGLGNLTPMTGMGGIDWAQLAQQWIHMRDTVPPPAAPATPNFGIMPMAPPPPIISNAPAYQRLLPSINYEEHGEADMDMDDDTERAHSIEMQISTPPPLSMPPITVAPQITQSANNTSEDLPFYGFEFNKPIYPILASGRGKHQQQQQQQQQWTNWPGQSNKAATSSPTAHIPSLLKLNVSNPNEPHMLQHQHPPNQHQQQLPHPQQQQQHQPSQQLQSEMNPIGGGSGNASEIDSNKRKMLPAWIREGLEKMEREKQRQLERQQPLTPPTGTSLGLKLLESSPDPDIPKHPHVLVPQGHNVKQVSSKTLTTPVNLMNLTNVPSDSEDSNEEFSKDAPSALVKGKDMLIRRRSQSASSLTETDPDDDNKEKTSLKQHQNEVKNDAATRSRQAQNNGKNYEERLADLMLVVRRTLTELLLETTNEEIAAIASETIKAHRAKASSAQVIRKSALSSITGNLGLAAYGDSSSESEGDDDDNKDTEEDEMGIGNTDSPKEESKNLQQLSSEELKARIRRSKRSFEKVINDIENRVAEQEQRDERELEKHRKLEMEHLAERKDSRDSSLNNSQTTGEALMGSLSSGNDKVKKFNGKRPSRKERTTRFSDNKDGKQTNQSFVQHVVASATPAPAASGATTSSSTAVSSKIKPIPNVATNLLQMPESVTNMLNAADKALQKVNKSTRKSKAKRRRSSTSSSSSSSSGSSSSSTNSSSSSSDSSTSATTKSSSSRSINSKKKNKTSSHRAPSNSRSSRHHRDQESSSSRSRSRNKYDRREYNRERQRERELRHHYGSSSSMHRRRPHHRDSSHSGDEHRERHRSRHGGGNDYGKKRNDHRSPSRSRSRNSQHHHHSISHSSSSSHSHHRKRV